MLKSGVRPVRLNKGLGELKVEMIESFREIPAGNLLLVLNLNRI